MANKGRTSRKNKKKQGNKLVAVLIILLVLLLVLVGGMLYYFLVVQPARTERQVTGGQREAAALQGTIDVMTEEEIAEELDNIIEEGMFRISIASQIVGFEHGMNEVRIENHLNNRYLMQVSIYLDETGEEIFATDLIDPGYYIQETKYDKDLKAGEYDATAVFTALYPDTEEIVGTAGAQVKLIVLPNATPTPTPSPSPSPSPSATPEA